MALSPEVQGFGRVLVGVGKRDGLVRDVKVDLAAVEVEKGLMTVEVEAGLDAEEDLVTVEVEEGLVVEGLEVVDRVPAVDGLEELTEAELMFRTEVLLLLLEKELLE